MSNVQLDPIDMYKNPASEVCAEMNGKFPALERHRQEKEVMRSD